MNKRLLSLLLSMVCVLALLCGVAAMAADAPRKEAPGETISQDDIDALKNAKTPEEFKSLWNALPQYKRKAAIFRIQDVFTENGLKNFSKYDPLLLDDATKTGMAYGYIEPEDYTDPQLDAALELIYDIHYSSLPEHYKDFLNMFFGSDFSDGSAGQAFVSRFTPEQQQRIAAKLDFFDIHVDPLPSPSPSPSPKPTPKPSTKPTPKPSPSPVPIPKSSFTDVKAGAFYEKAVDWAVYKGVTKGISQTEFGPDDDCTRGHIVTFLWRAKGSPEPKTTLCPFEDVNPKGFYYRAMLWAVENGITKGIDATHFGPEEPCTRSQAVTFLWRAEGSPAPSSGSTVFTDVSPKGFYYQAMLWAGEESITKGTSATTFGPDDTCSRGHIVTFLYRDLARVILPNR